MKEELSLARVVKALEKTISEKPTPELIESYSKLLDRLNAPEPSAASEGFLSRFEELERRVVFLESLQKVRVIKDGRVVA
jgi:hypothetical protein